MSDKLYSYKRYTCELWLWSDPQLNCRTNTATIDASCAESFETQRLDKSGLISYLYIVVFRAGVLALCGNKYGNSIISNIILSSLC